MTLLSHLFYSWAGQDMWWQPGNEDHLYSAEHFIWLFRNSPLVATCAVNIASAGERMTRVAGGWGDMRLVSGQPIIDWGSWHKTQRCHWPPVSTSPYAVQGTRGVFVSDGRAFVMAGRRNGMHIKHWDSLHSNTLNQLFAFLWHTISTF